MSDTAEDVVFLDMSLEELLSLDISKMSASDAQALDEALQEVEAREVAKKCQTSLLAFCKHIDPSYTVGVHHRRLATLLEQVARGEKDRIAVSVAPRHGKSLLTSTYFPAWFLGNWPKQRVMMVTHTTDLSVDFGRKVRNIIDSAAYRQIFPAIKISADSKSAGRWGTNAGGEYYATSVGSALAGRGADLLLCDDPHSEQALLSGNAFDNFADTFKWFASGARTRLSKEGRVALVHCMTGDTRVLMHDNSEKLLREVRPGDMVASYTKNNFVPAKVLNWANQGLDKIYSIGLRSGVIIRGNERHPFLVDTGGTQTWVKVKDLRVGMGLVSLKDARTWAKPKQNPGCATPVLLGRTTTNITPTHPTTPLGIMANGKAKLARLKGAMSQCIQTVTAPLAGIRLRMLGAKPKGLTTALNGAAVPTSRCSMASQETNTTTCSLPKKVFVQYVESPPTTAILHSLGKSADWLLTTAIHLMRLGRSCATPVISSLKSGTPQSYYAKPLSIWSTTTDNIVSITYEGEEDVFDIQVEGTENFIANGVVSHNTRWHPADLIGSVAKEMTRNPEADQYEFFEFPAILNENTANEKALWPEFFDLKALHRTKASMPAFQWNAQYQQALALHTPIPTPSGWSTMGEIKVGDYVISADGKPVVVTWVSEVFSNRPTYYVETDDGACVQADEEHLWEVQTMRADGPRMVKTTKWMYNRQEKRTAKGAARRRPRIRQCEAWDLPEVDLPIDPYVLGAWLGDGTKDCAQFTSSVEDAIWWGAEFSRLGYGLTKYAKAYSYQIPGAIKGLRKAGVIGNKHVPLAYMRASRSQRLAVLQGLLDTDGHCSRGQAQFANTNVRLVKAVEELALSLGAKPCTVSFEATAGGKRGKTCYKVQFYMPEAFRMPRKAALARGKHNKHGRFVTLRPAPIVDTKCIRVANSDGLFLAGERCLVTHNCPTAEEASLVKREWWRLWDKDEPPDCEYIIMALDAAAEANNRADFTALTTWGVFTDDNLTQGASHIILLNAINVRVEFPELKDLALREYKEWEPDAFIVEKKSSGTPLFQELRRMGVPVSEFTPHRGTGDKIARLNAVADIFRSGMVWYPAGRRWAEEVIEQVASFPASENDDLVDTVSMSLARYRAGGFIRLASDEKDEPAIFRSRRQAAYY